jgi:uncharacterized protein with HEPN domain
MPRDFKLYLDDILESTSRILEYSGGTTIETLLTDKMRLDAIVRNLEIIGEASGKLPGEIKDKYPSVEWKKIANFRNLLAHEYFGIDYEILWDIINNKIPNLQQIITDIINHAS